MLSEVLSNEPAGRVRLEWVEIFNDSDLEINLGEFIFIAEPYVNQLPNGILLQPYGYAVLSRQVIPEDGSDSFESYWGDSSGVWGDHESENFQVIGVSMILNNNSGHVGLENEFGLVLDEFSWNTSSDDGRSVERDDIHDITSGWHDCFDPGGSTPGRPNSAVPPGGGNSFTVDIDPVAISTADLGIDNFAINIVIPPASELTVKIFDETGYGVRTLAERNQSGALELFWNGRDNEGRPLSPGVYIISLDLTGQVIKSKQRPVVIAP